MVNKALMAKAEKLTKLYYNIEDNIDIILSEFGIDNNKILDESPGDKINILIECLDSFNKS